MIIEATDETFEGLIQEGIGIIDFYSTHCGPCRALLPTLLEIENEMPFITLIKVNTDFCIKIAEKYRIESLPTIYLFKNGKMNEFSSTREKENFESSIGTLLYEE